MLYVLFVLFQDFANPLQMAEVNNAKTDKKMTGVLTCVLFERSVLASSSVTGKSKEGRPALDPVKVQLIIGRHIHNSNTFSCVSHQITTTDWCIVRQIGGCNGFRKILCHV